MNKHLNIDRNAIRKMNIILIQENMKNLISPSNPEWQEILSLRQEVQRDFHDHESLSIPTYHKILEWQLRGQKSQIRKIITFSPDALVKTITHCYYKIHHPDEEMKTRIKVQVLLSIPWIGIGISSAIMALHEPQLYGTIDSRSWSVLFQKDKKTFSGNDYLKYLKAIRNIADQVECDVQEIDHILWKEYEV